MSQFCFCLLQQLFLKLSYNTFGKGFADAELLTVFMKGLIWLFDLGVSRPFFGDNYSVMFSIDSFISCVCRLKYVFVTIVILFPDTRILTHTGHHHHRHHHHHHHHHHHRHRLSADLAVGAMVLPSAPSAVIVRGMLVLLVLVEL
jgi:hypothetical protein